jgi:hypothetical protein
MVPLRDGELELNHDIADGPLGMVDALRDILSHIEADGSEGNTEDETLADSLATLLNDERTAAERKAEVSGASLSEDEVFEAIAELNRSDLEAEPDAVVRPKRTAAPTQTAQKQPSE